MKNRATIILMALGLLLMGGGLLLVAYSDEESQSGDGESHSEGAPQDRDALPGSPSAAGPSAPTKNDPRASQTAPFTTSAEQSVAASATRSGTMPSPGGSGSTADILLAQQIVAAASGGDLDGRCSTSTTASPAAYISNFLGNEGLEVDLINWVGVCLRGFDPVAPVGLTVDVGGRNYQTEIRLSDDEVEVEGEFGIVDYSDRPETLFDGVPLTAFRVSGEDAYRTMVWEFVPPSAVRDTIVSVVLTARQGELLSEVVQPVNIPGEEPGEEMLSNGRELAVWGFPAGRRVEIGLYRRDGNSDVFSLVRRVGVITMPASSLAVFTVPEDVIREAGDNRDYCLSAPVQTVPPCEPYS